MFQKRSCFPASVDGVWLWRVLLSKQKAAHAVTVTGCELAAALNRGATYRKDCIIVPISGTRAELSLIGCWNRLSLARGGLPEVVLP